MDARASLCPGEGHEPTQPGATDRTLAQAIEATVARHPDRPAVSVGRRTLGYEALDRAANRVAVDLVEGGVRPGDLVGVMAGQSAAMVVAIIGVLKAGAAYVPLDPGHPPGRTAAVIKSMGIAVVVADPAAGIVAATAVAAAIAAAAPTESGAPLRVIVASDAPGGPVVAPPRQDDPESLAYVYATSGSTGRPKAVMDTHRNVLDNVRRYTDTLRIGPGDRLSLVQTITFSGAVSSLFGALANGACVHPFDVRAAGVAAARDWVARDRLTMLHAVPVVFRGLTDGRASFPDLRVVRLEGDAAAWSDVERFRRHVPPGAVLVNGLGATETGLVRQFFVDHALPLGTGGLPLGYAVHGVDVRMEDGEIVVMGRHLALGYWGDPERTSAAFVDLGDGVRAYRTGDLGRLEPDGRLVGLGRRGHAEKVRGQAIDLPEIERRLRAESGIRDAAVVTRRHDDGEPRVAAYVVPAAGRSVDTAALRRRLATALPVEAVPTTITAVASLPLDANGKLDRRSLPAPDPSRPDLPTPYLAPRSALEREITAVWERVLGVAPVGVRDEFFDLGGDSLDAARLGLELSEIADREVTHDAVLVASTVEDLALRIGASADGRAAPVPRWFGLHDDPGNAGFYARVARAAEGRLDIRTLGPAPDAAADRSIDAIATGMVDRIRAAQPDGPYHVMGYCFAATLALATAHRLQAEGDVVAAVALLGIGPTEFPELVVEDALRAPDDGRVLRQRLRAHLAELRARDPIRGGRYLVDHALARSRRLARRVVTGRDPVAARAAVIAATPAAPFDGAVTVVLGRASAAVYTTAPDRAWERLGSGSSVRVVLLPGHDHAMLGVAGARGLADALEEASGTLPAVTGSLGDRVP